jgi:ATP-dependent exoDNAse (exonuclease V) alpha subunit
MAIYHLSVKAISRSAGRSATAAAAYRAGCEIRDERTGEVHDYTRKGGVESTDLVLPDGAPTWAANRNALWNAAEQAERRKDACVAREFVVALPAELPAAERHRLARDFAQDMANREGCAVDIAIHAPSRGGDDRNHHAHLLRTTRKVEWQGLGAKLDTERAGRNRIADLAAVRSRWADLTNARLRAHGISAQIDHRSLEAQGIDRTPTKHLGPSATGYERRTGESSRRRLDMQQEASTRLQQAKEAGELERASAEAGRSILDLSGNLQAAVRERDWQPTAEFRQQAAEGMAAFQAQFAAYQLAQEGQRQFREAFAKHEAEQARQQVRSPDEAPPEQTQNAGQRGLGYSR